MMRMFTMRSNCLLSPANLHKFAVVAVQYTCVCVYDSYMY